VSPTSWRTQNTFEPIFCTQLTTTPRSVRQGSGGTELHFGELGKVQNSANHRSCQATFLHRLAKPHPCCPLRNEMRGHMRGHPRTQRVRPPLAGPCHNGPLVFFSQFPEFTEPTTHFAD